MAKFHQKKSSATDEYLQSMREFREVLERAGHKIMHRLEHPRFIEKDSQSSRRRRH